LGKDNRSDREELRWWFWFRLTKGGRPPADWLAIGRRHGYVVDDPDAPVLYDTPLGHNDQLLLRNLPNLDRILLVIGQRDRLGVPQLGHFGSEDIWFEAAAVLARKGALVHDCLTGKLFDLAADPGAAPEGAMLVRRQASAARTEAARRESAKAKRGRKALSGARLHRAMVERGEDDGRSAGAVAASVGAGVATMYREMVDDNGQRVGRVAAITLSKQGVWPPPRPRRG
jgi:hypothetical protein